mgnify:CR=1 FL=1
MTANGAGPAIRVCGLTKDYGRDRGVFDVSLEVAAGEVLGFLGPNGAGKIGDDAPPHGIHQTAERKGRDSRARLLP